MVIPFVLDVDPVSRSLRTWHMGGPHCWVTEMGAYPTARRGCPPLFVLSADVQTCDPAPQSRHTRGGNQGWAPRGLVSSLPVSTLLFLSLPTTSLPLSLLLLGLLSTAPRSVTTDLPPALLARTKENGSDRDPLHPDPLSKRPCTLSPAQRFSPSNGLPHPTPPHYRLEDMALAHHSRDSYRHPDPRELRERHRQLSEQCSGAGVGVRVRVLAGAHVHLCVGRAFKSHCVHASRRRVDGCRERMRMGTGPRAQGIPILAGFWKLLRESHLSQTSIWGVVQHPHPRGPDGPFPPRGHDCECA